MDFSVPMALVDFLPVVLFCIAAVIMQRCLYDRMTKGGFAVYCAGTMMIVAAGAFKALWKLLYALGLYDVQALNACFMPMQATGFLLAAIALLGYVFSKEGKKGTKVAAAVPVMTSSLPFIILMVLGLLGLSVGYVTISVRNKRTKAVIMFIIDFFLQLAMGYLSSRDFSQAYMNWICEAINTLAMVTLLIGVNDLKKNVFAD